MSCGHKRRALCRRPRDAANQLHMRSRAFSTTHCTCNILGPSSQLQGTLVWTSVICCLTAPYEDACMHAAGLGQGASLSQNDRHRHATHHHHFPSPTCGSMPAVPHAGMTPGGSPTAASGSPRLRACHARCRRSCTPRGGGQQQCLLGLAAGTWIRGIVITPQYPHALGRCHAQICRHAQVCCTPRVYAYAHSMQ